jgi:predicted peptidase
MRASIVRGRDEKVLRHCQVKVDLILDEVESKVHVDSTGFYILHLVKLMVVSLRNNKRS